MPFSLHLMTIFSLFARRHAVAAVLAGGAALSLSSCLSISDAEGSDRIGSITISSTLSSQVPRRASATATFFTTQPTDLPNSRVERDQCGTFNYVPESFAPGNLLAGESLQLQVGGQSYSMSERAGVPRVYGLTSGNTFPYASGDTARVAIPGTAGGFPPGQISVRLAEPIDLAPIVVGGSDQDLAFQWALNGDANSSVIISMRYTTAVTTEVPDAQLLCVVRDNGSYTIPAGTLGIYYASNPASRQVNVLRWRTNTARVDERSQLYIVSTTDTTFTLPEVAAGIR
jgi:hypothetical protein